MKEQLTDELLAFEADHVWINKNLETLLERYTDQWIGVKDCQVVTSDPELEGLLSKLSDPAHTCVDFITREPIEIVLRQDLWVAKHDLEQLPPEEVARILRLPSVLGRDVLSRFPFTCDYQEGIVQLGR